MKQIPRHFNLLTEVENVFLSESGPISDVDIRITPFIDVKGRVFFWGCLEEYKRNLLHELFQNSSKGLYKLNAHKEKLYEIEKFIQRNRHIIRVSSGRFQIRSSLSSCSIFIEKISNMTIKKVFDNPPEGIKIKHIGSFHLPSGMYTTKFIQLQHLLQVKNWSKKLAYFLVTKIHLRSIGNKDIDFILGCTASASPLVEHVAESLSFEPDESCLCIETYIDSLDYPDFEEIPAGKKVLIVTDVISTGGLIKRMAEAVIKRKAKPFAIAAIVDTREVFESKVEVNGIDVEVYALYHEYIQKYNQPIRISKKGQQIGLFPEKSEVIEVDPLTTTPCYKVPLSPQVLIEPKEFFTKFIRNSFALANRHISTGGTHFCFYVDTKEIFQDEQIASKIIKRIVERLQKDLSHLHYDFLDKESCLLTILYPWGSNASYATNLFISKINEFIGIKKISTRGIFRSKSNLGWRFGPPDQSYDSVIKDKVVVIWDDGANSGDTLSQLIDYTCSFMPREVLVYVLISRVAPSYRKFFQRIRSYRIEEREIRVSITFVTSLDLPTYRPNNCPCCKRLIDIEADSIKPFANLEPIKEHLERERNRLKVIRLKNIRKEIKSQQYDSLSELSRESEQFREEMSSLIIMRETIAKLESFLPIEDDRNLLKEEMLDQDNLKFLCRIIRDETETWEKIIRQCPDVADSILSFCTDTLIGGFDPPKSFDLIAIEILFSKQKHTKLVDNLDKCILRIQHSREIMNCFIYHIIKFLNDDGAVKILERCRNICESNRNNETLEEVYTRVKINKTIQWVRLNRAQNAGNKGHLKEAIVSLENMYSLDPHKSAFEWWNKLMVTSLSAGVDNWSTRYKWWNEEINPLMQAFVKNIETLQPILSNIPIITPYLLTVSKPNFIDDLTALDEKLHVLCMGDIDKIIYSRYYEQFLSIVNRLYEMIVSKESFLAELIKKFPTNLDNEVNFTLRFLKEDMERKDIELNIQTIPSNIEILFHKTLFNIAFREFVLNMCKHSEMHISANLAVSTNEETVEVKLNHPGKLKHTQSLGIGEGVIEELVLMHGGKFTFPHEINKNIIESKMILKIW